MDKEWNTTNKKETVMKKWNWNKKNIRTLRIRRKKTANEKKEKKNANSWHTEFKFKYTYIYIKCMSKMKYCKSVCNIFIWFSKLFNALLFWTEKKKQVFVKFTEISNSHLCSLFLVFFIHVNSLLYYWNSSVNMKSSYIRYAIIKA